MVRDTIARLVPDAGFVQRIDDLLEKAVPDQAIPWPGSPPPTWAAGFKPRQIVDLGAGVGGFTHSIIVRLGQWGCLDRLERVVLIEGATDVLPGGADALELHLRKQVEDALALFGKVGIPIEILLSEISIVEGTERDEAVIPVLEDYGKSDLLVASHLTYYFSDGSGRELVSCLTKNYLSLEGRIWCVVRNRDCPIYQARAALHEKLGIEDIKPYDYAEYFQSTVVPSVRRAELLEEQRHSYLSEKGFDGRLEAAHLLMWREEIFENSDDRYRDAVFDLAKDDAALFEETHFILGGRA